MPNKTFIASMARANILNQKRPAASEPVFIRADRPGKPSLTAPPPAPPPSRKQLINSNLAVNVGAIKLFNPAFSALLSNVTPAVDGVERTAIKAPVGPSENMTDEQLFEAPDDPAKKYYLPRYRILENTTATSRRFDISMKQTETGGTLFLKLEKYPAPSLVTSIAGVQEITHDVSILLNFDALMEGGGAMKKELPFKEATDEAFGVSAALTVEGLTQFTALYRALTESSINARLIVRRYVTIALPVSAPAGNNNNQVKMRKRIESERRANVFARTQGIKTGSTADLQIPVAPVPLYRETTRTLDDNISFSFPLAMHGYIFKDIVPGASPAGPSLMRRPVGADLYYQDMETPGVFYYLPDRFKIVRRPDPPFPPFMSVSFSEDASLDETTVTLDYVAVPYTDPARIQSAEGRLQQFLNANQEVHFQPLIAPATFSMAWPGAGGGALAGPFRERAGAMVELREGIHDSLTLSLSNFQLLYDALLGASQTLFTGQVIVSAAGNDKIQIPFSARMEDLAGDVCSIRELYDPTSGKGTITIRNEIESPLTIGGIQVRLTEGNTPLPFNSYGTDPNTLLRLEPKQEVIITVSPLDASFAGKPLSIEAALSGVEVLPDREAIWNAILNPNTPLEYNREITVETFDELFTEDNSIKAILVNFLNGDSVTLRRDALKATTTVSMPYADYILGKTDTREYKYQVEVITVAGKRKIGAADEWRTDNAEQLFIMKDAIS